MTDSRLAELERPFRFGVVSGAARGGADWAATARRLESAGFATLLVPDNLDAPAPLIALAVAAAATSSLRVGSYVMVAGLRPPAVLAWEAGTLQSLSDGRLELGLGLGRPDAESDAQRLGVPLGKPGRQLARMVEVLDAVHALPEDRRPPILMAAAGPRMLELAGQRADTVALGLSFFATVEQMTAAAVAVCDAAAAAGRPAPPELTANLLLAGDGELPDWVRARMHLDPQALRSAGATTVLDGTPAQMADTLLRRREQTGVSYITGGAHLADALSRVIPLLADR